VEFKQVLSPSQRVFLMVGVLGGFTTFSAFAYETFELAHSREFAGALANVVAQVVVGFSAAARGYIGARYV
jgi:CrcB protein